MTGKNIYFAILLVLTNFKLFEMALSQNAELRSEFQLDKSKTSPCNRTHETIGLSSLTGTLNESQIEGTRFRRAINSGRRDKCGTASQCSGNRVLLESVRTYYNCYCDNACYETFQDCCPDYVKTCGEQNETNTRNSQPFWKCLTVGEWNIYYDDVGDDCTLFGPSGIWMIANCSSNWPSDEIRSKCENASRKFSYPVEDYIPVVGKNGLTYRNKHCAECNEETSYQTWEIVVRESLTPPKQYNLDDKLRFLLENGGYIQNIGPARHMSRRYCAAVIDGCFNTSHSAYEGCLNGPVETVVDDSDFDRQYFKNKACASCSVNGKNTHFGERSTHGCAGNAREYAKSFSIVFNVNKQSHSESTVNQVVTANCPKGLVYDDTLEYCRQGVVTDIDDILSDVFFVALWFEESAIQINFHNNIIKHLKSGLARKYALKPNQLTAFQFHRQNSEKTLLVATFHLTLTLYQEFILDNQNSTSNLNISDESRKFLGLLKSTTNFSMQIGGYSFQIIKLVSKQLACFDGRTLQSHEYENDNISGNVIEIVSGNVFSKNEYAILGKIGKNITICRRLMLSGCQNGAFVTLNEREYFVYKNLTLFHYQTNRTFNFGEYQIIDSGTSTRSNLDMFKNASFPRNLTVAICLPFRQTFNTTEKITKSDTNHPLRNLTLICFSVSILFLLILLVTYCIFDELRTLPGLNLMSLAVSMLLSQLIWLIGTANFMKTRTCEVLGIIEHYLFLVAFMAMSVISYHSCIVFSRPFGRSPHNASPALTKILKYTSVAWISPAIFIVVCVTLDQTKASFDIYGTTCWLSTRKAVLYLFILPAAVITLFNIITFTKTALTLCYNKDTEILRTNRKQNLIACIKLATLVAFPWLFAFFGAIFPDIEAFEYLFVVFACLQGFYMGVAFVCNKKTLQLYKNWWQSRNTPGSQSNTRNETFQMS